MNLDTDFAESPMLAKSKGKKLKQYLAATSVSFGAVCAGTCLAWTSPALAQLSLAKNHTDAEKAEKIDDFGFYLSDNEGAIVGGILAIGALISAIPTGFLVDKFGRKKIVLILSLAFLLNWIIIIFAKHPATLIVGRIFAGIGTGGICVAGPMYISEIAEPSLRGTLGGFINMFLCVGILLTSIFGSFTSWRILSIILAVIPVIFGGSFLLMPESPAYLMKTKRKEEARRTMIKLRGLEYDVEPELREIEREVHNSQENKLTFHDVISSRAYRRALFSVVGVLAFQQLCGINVVVFYTVPIFQAAGSSLSPNLAGIIISIVQVSSSYLSLFIIEKANRKFYLMLSSCGMLIFLTALGMFFHLKKINYDLNSVGFIPIMSAVMFMVFFSVGYGPVPWMLMGELFAPEIKGIGNGLAIATNWTCAFLVTYFFPIINSGVGAHVAFYICAIIMAVASVYVMFVVPETRGKTLLEIQQVLNK